MIGQLTLFDYNALDTETRIVVQQRTTEIKALMKRAAGDIIDAGLKSIEVRTLLRHNKGGGFEGWIRYEGLESRMIYHFIRVAETFGNFENFSKLNIGVSALYLLAAPSTPESARDEALARASTGEPITHQAARDIISNHRNPPIPFVPDEEDNEPLTPYEAGIAAQYTNGAGEPNEPTDDGASRMKPKINRAGDMYEPRGFDACQTPAHAIDPLLPYLSTEWTVWEPACGEGMLVEAFYDAGRNVIGSDILTGDNFFTCDGPDRWDCLITNPPYSIKYPWLERCYQLGKPFALLLPVETLGAQRAQALFVEHGVQIILLDKRINFKMPNIGWDGSSAQFPVAWFTWGFQLETQIVFAKINATD
jgi:hypothetical protein